MTINTQFAIEVDDMLLNRARQGNREAFSELYQMFAKPCYNLAYRLAGNAQMAQDIVQDVFIKLMKSIESFRGESPFWGWLRQITINEALGCLRRNKRMTNIGEDDWKYDANVETETTPTGATERDMETLMSKLPDGARMVVYLYAVEGYTHREIAELFDQSESYSKSIYSRSMKKLQGLNYGQR